MQERPILHLIDGSGYIFRAYYAIRPLSTRTGLPTNAVLGFARMLLRLVREERPTTLGIAFDTQTPNFRHTLYPAYKANREAPPEDLVPQFALIHELVEAMDIPLLKLEGFEADDILATLSRQAIERGFDVVVVTGDKDLMQLVGEHLTLFDPMKEKHFDRAAVTEKFGVPPENVVDILALAGDTSDNIPGVPKVGPKSAAKLVSAFGDVEHVISGLKAQSKRKAYENNVVEHADMARLSKKLATLDARAPVQLDVEALHYTKPNPEKMAPFLQKIEAVTLMRDVGADAVQTPRRAPPPQPSAAVDAAPPSYTDDDDNDVPPMHSDADYTPSQDRLPAEPLTEDPVDRSQYRGVVSLADVDHLVAAIRAKNLFSVDLETTSIDPNRADIVGIALAVPGEKPAYIPLAHHYLGVPTQLKMADVMQRLQPVLEDPSIKKVGQHLKYDYVVFARAGVHLAGIAHDAMLAAYVLDPARVSYGLDALSREFLAHQNISYNTVTGTGKSRIDFAQVPVEQAIEYAAEDADVALRLCTMLWPDVENVGLAHVYRDIEIPLVPVLAEMERAGILVDIAHLKGLATEFNRRVVAIENEAFAHIGHPINLGSPKQLAHLFFEKLGYPVVKKTKTGFSTDQEVLETLARTYDLPRIILEHRLLCKLKSTYVDALPKMCNPETGRVHTSFNQTGTATGRLSSSDPNLQNIPIRSEDGRRIRAAFIAPPGHVIVSADYSQVELRVMAHLSEDPNFIEAFRNGEDIHRRTAMEILTGGAEPDHEMRRRAKAINFGILYGLSEFGLSRQLNIPRAEAHAYISAYFGRYPSIRGFLDACIDSGRRQGFVTTITGRRRHLPNLNSKNGNLRQAAERIAMNTPIQGSAADLIKLAMLRVASELRRLRLRSRLLLQVHDELVLEVPTEERETITQLLRHEMSTVMPLRVPVEVDVGFGPNWAEAH